MERLDPGLEFWILKDQAMFWFTFLRDLFTETVIDWRGYIEHRRVILSLSILWFEFYIDYILDFERIIDIEIDESNEID